jgi:formylmethanofuran dehydrogenase subunit E
MSKPAATTWTVEQRQADLDRATADGTHAPGVLCQQCGDRVDGYWERDGAGRWICRDCAERNKG